ncbi:MerR family transcriptional regulator [Priestia koreensis]|uniref:MerR family transcriptional regulator n=1 Tax=Priestia koreensis TaxID=284581 RepID=UPI001F571FFF|nr:MerR family transcriptional regulator [Priestia koreensis]MCM3006421.1 MerR family transcriptional regulator [Priestia koreensis]UNL83676.1 MerR family transcriptional regulator [Priestia koreensis]
MTLIMIDEVMKLTGLTKRAIRYYEEIGLIKPPQRTKGNIRQYTEEEVSALKKVVEAKEVLGFSLQELQHFMDLKETIERDQAQGRLELKELEHFEEAVEEQLDMIQKKIKSMMLFQQELQELLEKTKRVKTEQY